MPRFCNYTHWHEYTTSGCIVEAPQRDSNPLPDSVEPAQSNAGEIKVPSLPIVGKPDDQKGGTIGCPAQAPICCGPRALNVRVLSYGNLFGGGTSISSVSEGSPKANGWALFVRLSTTDPFLFFFFALGFLLSVTDFLRFFSRALFFALRPASIKHQYVESMRLYLIRGSPRPTTAPEPCLAGRSIVSPFL